MTLKGDAMRPPRRMEAKDAGRNLAVGSHGARTGGRGPALLALISLAVSALAAGLPVPALAEDFTVTVPIDLKTLPASITKGTVECQALNQARSYSIGATDFFFDIAGGNYTNTVVLKFNADPNRDARQAAFMSCALWIKDQNSGVFIHPSILLKDGGPYPGIDKTQTFREVTLVPIPNP